MTDGDRQIGHPWVMNVIDDIGAEINDCYKANARLSRASAPYVSMQYKQLTRNSSDVTVIFEAASSSFTE